MGKSIIGLELNTVPSQYFGERFVILRRQLHSIKSN